MPVEIFLSDILVCNILFRLEKLQTSIERQQGIQRKWIVASSLYKEVLARLKLKQGCQLLKKLHHLAAERIFVLEMKKKYAGK